MGSAGCAVCTHAMHVAPATCDSPGLPPMPTCGLLPRHTRRYCADRVKVRYYVDGDQNASIELEPAMAAGSGIGWEGLDYYQQGLDLKDPWPWGTTRMGKSAQSGGGWHFRYAGGGISKNWAHQEGGRLM